MVINWLCVCLFVECFVCLIACFPILCDGGVVLILVCLVMSFGFSCALFFVGSGRCLCSWICG